MGILKGLMEFVSLHFIMSAIRSMETTHKSTTVLRCKVIVVGDATVGKTALIQTAKSRGQEYPKNYVMTSGVEISVQSVPIPESNVVVELYLFDCAGQSVFNQREFGISRYKGGNATMVVYDINNKESFKAVSKWYQDVVSAIPTHNIHGVLIGNKTELRKNNRDAVSITDAKELAQQNNLTYFECSAQQYINVDAPFTHIAEWFYQKYLKATQDLKSF